MPACSTLRARTSRCTLWLPKTLSRRATPQKWTWPTRKLAETFSDFIFAICSSCSIEAVLDARAQPAHVDTGVAHRLQRRQHVVDRGIAIAVDRQLPTLAGAVDGLRLQVLDAHVGEPAVVGIQVGLALQSGEAWLEPSATSL
jgi:hypothetical protein